MRTKDNEKEAALFEATVKLVNDIGFASSSVSKIAREAGVSPATIYVYHKNKQGLLVSTYIAIKLDLSKALLRGFNDRLPIRDILKNVWFNMFEYISNNLEYYKFIEQFSSSPYSFLINRQEVEQYFDPLTRVLQTGIEQKIIKNVSINILAAFMYYPITVLANPSLSPDFELNEENIETAFTLAWDAIKL
ncbi:MAG: TetR/AcrR family transcriptional regulator [Desulfobacteraceae bacterium]|jgi:AcrR family transcriptional regulator|nr:TetR/AcrR family transcriptional regulator [Desulfobacteraceae bacterium]